MPLKSYFFILFIIFIASGSSVGLLLFYMNPLSDKTLAMSLMGTGLFLVGSSFFAPLLFFIKKIYYRGDVSLRTMNASLRQAILITSGLMFTLFLYMFQIYESRVILAVWATLGCIEVMIQAIE